MEISGETLDDVWGASVQRVLEEGMWVPTENGVDAIELTNVMLKLAKPVRYPKPPQLYPASLDYVTHHVSTFEETYSGLSINSRLYNYRGEHDQIQRIVEHLDSNWYTRRAVVTTWDPATDMGAPQPPCPIVLNFLVRDNRLTMTAVLRSNDAWLVAVPDIIALTNVQHSVAELLNREVGEYCHLAMSYHIYRPAYPLARRAVLRQLE